MYKENFTYEKTDFSHKNGYILILGKYGDSGEDVSVNTDRSPEKMGSNMD